MSDNDRVTIDADTPVSLLRALGLVVDEPEDTDPLAWQAQGLCAQTDPETFFPEGRGRHSADAKAVCAVCPVREACLEYALDADERFGIWGGLTDRERRAIRKRRSADAELDAAAVA